MGNRVTRNDRGKESDLFLRQRQAGASRPGFHGGGRGDLRVPGAKRLREVDDPEDPYRDPDRIWGTGILIRTGYGGGAYAELLEKIGVLFEFPYLYTNLSAVDNLRYFASFYPRERVRDVMELLDKLEFKKDYLKKPVSSYSKGMRQRVSMARALLNSPRLLFLDEPISGLDPSGAVLFRRIIEEERRNGTTVFLTTHNMMDADLLCDRVAFISNGNIAALDTPQNLKKQNCMDSKEPTLEEVFIQYTGRGLEE